MHKNDIDFKDEFVGHRKSFGQQWNHRFGGERYGDNFSQKSNYMYETIMLSLVKIWVQLS